MIESMNGGFYQIRGLLVTLQDAFNKNMDWYKQQMDNLKEQLSRKDKEIEDLKKKLNEKSTR